MDPELLPRGLERAHLPGARYEHPRAQPALPRGQWPAPSRKIFYTKPKNISGEGWRGAAGHQPNLDAAGGRQLRGHGPHRLRVQEVRHVSDG